MRIIVVSRIEAWHVNALNLAEALYTFEEHSPPFHDGSGLKERLLLEAADFVTQGLPSEGG
jgi:hypothetical protein